MFRNGCRRNSTPLGDILKIIIGGGLAIITIALILSLIDTLSSNGVSWQAQMAAYGCIVLIMGFLSLKLFERL